MRTARASHTHLAQATYGMVGCPACDLIRVDAMDRRNASAFRFDPLDVLAADFGEIRHPACA